MADPDKPLGRRALLVLAAVACGCSGGPRGSVTIVASRGPFATIEEAARSEDRVDWWDRDPRDDDACTESFAATELARLLPACLGIPATQVRLADSVPDSGDAIVLGSRASSPLVASLAQGSPPAPQGFRLESSHDRRRRRIVVEGADRAGSLYGAYALLERLGTRFHGLGAGGVSVPALPAGWPERLALRESPAFAIRGFWAFEPRGNRELFEWMAANRMNLWTSVDTSFVPLMKKLAIRLTAGGHGAQGDLLDPARYFASHPEWYGLQGGQRSPNLHGESGDNFCTSNAAARRQLAANLVASLESGRWKRADMVELWMLDAGRWCECDACKAQGTPTERLLAVADEAAAAVDSARARGSLARPVEVRTLAYLDTRRPPPAPRPGGGATVAFYPYFRCYAHALADSSCREMNARLVTDYRGWRAIRPSTSWGVCEYYNVGAFKSLPLVFPGVMAADLREYRRTGATEITYMHAPSREWGSWTLQHALFARLLWNPATDPDSFAKAFCRGSYGAASPPMEEFYRNLATASANIVALQACAGVYGSGRAGGRLVQPDIPVFPMLHLREEETHPPTDDGADLDEIDRAMKSARRSLDRARASVRDSLARRRIEEAERRFAYGEAMIFLYTALIRTAAAHRDNDGASARRQFATAEEAAGRLRNVVDLVQVSASHANARDGFEASGVKETYEYFARLYGR